MRANWSYLCQSISHQVHSIGLCLRRMIFTFLVFNIISSLVPPHTDWVDHFVLKLYVYVEQMSTNQPPTSSSSALSASGDEYMRLKLELAAKRASVDTVRLQARQLISKRDGVSIIVNNSFIQIFPICIVYCLSSYPILICNANTASWRCV